MWMPRQEVLPLLTSREIALLHISLGTEALDAVAGRGVHVKSFVYIYAYRACRPLILNYGMCVAVQVGMHFQLPVYESVRLLHACCCQGSQAPNLESSRPFLLYVTSSQTPSLNYFLPVYVRAEWRTSHVVLPYSLSCSARDLLPFSRLPIHSRLWSLQKACKPARPRSQ